MKQPSVWGGALLVSGTAIGAGMLALPIVTAEGGFFPAIGMYFLCWAFMSLTGLLLLEACLLLPRGANLVSLSEHFLGRKGKVFAWMLYLFLFYSLSVAYISLGASLVKEVFFFPMGFSAAVFVVFFGFMVYRGARMVDRVNLFLMGGLVATYLFFLVVGVKFIQKNNLYHCHIQKAFLGLPVIFTSFSYQGIIPSLTQYLQRDVRKLRRAILMGTSLVFFIYVIWEGLVLGMVPQEKLLEAYQKQQTAIQPFKYQTNLSFLYPLGKAFSFFAVTTSFLGVTLGLFDFLADGLKKIRIGRSKRIIALFTFGPPFLIQAIYPEVFLLALRYAGGIGCALLLGFLPTWIVYRARYQKKEQLAEKPISWGKPLFFILFAFVFAELCLEGYVQWFFKE